MSVKNCHLCRTLGPPSARKVHGFRVDGLGMVDFACPTSQDAYERDLAACRDIVNGISMQAQALREIERAATTKKEPDDD